MAKKTPKARTKMIAKAPTKKKTQLKTPSGDTPSQSRKDTKNYSKPEALPVKSKGRRNSIRKGTLPVKGWLTCMEAAHIIGCHKDYARILVRTGKLEGIQYETIPGSGLCYWVIDPKSVKKFMEVRQSTGYPRGRPRS